MKKKNKKDLSPSKIKPKNKENIDNSLVRLNKFIAASGVCSRRDADTLIETGQIKVNGKVITELGSKILPSDLVMHKGKKLSGERFKYILLNKPKDYITTTNDTHSRKIVMDLVGEACRERIFPVGRLDKNTTGLLLFTNDGNLAKTLTHPSNKVKKVYYVNIDSPIKEEDFIKIKEGVILEDGKAIVDNVAIVSEDRKSLGIEIHIGKNRIIRRLFEALGYKVIKLDRVMVGNLTKKKLPRGKWRFLTKKEVINLKYLK